MKCIRLLTAGFVIATALSALAAAPVITCPTNIEVDCTKASEPVEFNVTARDDAGNTVPVVCTPSSGTIFPLGEHRVLCTATDERRNTSTCVFYVEVEDTAGPALFCPSNLTARASSAHGAIVSWRASATDDCGSASAVTCQPPSGSVFPIGRTAVLCTASDETGNAEHCSFLVSVLPPAPLRIERGPSNLTMLLKWQGDQALQHSPELRPMTPWTDSTLPVVDEGGDLTVTWPNPGRTHFFRLRAIPFLDTRDNDGDGVPDSRDRCPDTPPGKTVDEFGCSPIDIVRAPEELLGAVQKPWTDAANLLARYASETNPPLPADFASVMRYTDLAQTDLTRAIESFGAGDLCSGADAYDSALTGWSTARVALEVLIREATAEWERREPSRSEEGDVRSEENYLLNLQDLAATFEGAHDKANSSLPAVQSACRAVKGPGTARGRVVSIDNARRLVKLDTDVVIVLPQGEMRGHFDLGVLVNVSGLDLNDGSMVGNSMGADTIASDDVLNPKTVFRIAPVQPFPPEGNGPYMMHHPEAYKGIGSRLVLERGMRLSAGSIGGFVEGPPSTNSLKIELKYENKNGGYTTKLAASALKPGDPPVPIPAFWNDKALLGDEQIVVTRQAKNPTNDSIITLETTNIPVRIVLQGAVCSAVYDETEFDLLEANDQFDGAITFVESINRNPFLFGPEDPGTIPVFEFRNHGGALRDGTDSFFVFNDFDPSGFDPGVFNDGSLYQKGVHYPVGITWPKYRGKRNQRTFWYSVDVPRIVRDRINTCNGEDSYYKLPMDVGWPTWTMGQGNLNPGFTHCPGCYNQYAFDFVAAQNTPILAARGGTVLSFIESRSQNCWNAQTSSCTQNCPGSNRLKLLHQDGTVGVYMHMPQNSINLNVGARVFRGDSFLIVGNVGCSSNPHLHFQVDPEDGAALSMQIKFQAFNACAIFQPPFIEPCGIRPCYIPDRGEILFSTQ